MLSPKITSQFFIILGDRIESKNLFQNFLESIRGSLFLVKSQKFDSIRVWPSKVENTGFDS